MNYIKLNYENKSVIFPEKAIILVESSQEDSNILFFYFLDKFHSRFVKAHIKREEANRYFGRFSGHEFFTMNPTNIEFKKTKNSLIEFENLTPD